MKKRLAIALLLLSAVFGTAGCNSAWWQNFQNNPVAVEQAFAQSAQVALSLATATWNNILPLLPAAAQAAAQAKFNQALVAANAALATLGDAVQAAVDVQGPTPNWAGLMQAVTDAVSQVATIISDFQNQTSPAATANQELVKAVAAMKHAGHTK